MKKMKIGIIGYFGYGNAGDEAMKEILLAEFPGSVANFKQEIEPCDAYIVAGGDLVQGFSGLHMPKIWQNIKSEPCYALSLGVKTGWEKYEEDVIKWLSKFRIIYTREQESFDILSKFVEVTGVMPDLVLMADAEKSKEKYPILFNFTDRPWLWPGKQFESVVTLSDIYPVALSAEIFDTKYTENVVDFKTFLSMAKSSKGVIGTRLHCVVMGAIAGVPLAAICYEGKVKKFCDRYGIPTFNYGEENGLEIVNNMKKANLDLATERTKIKKAIDEIKKDLEDYFNEG